MYIEGEVWILGKCIEMGGGKAPHPSGEEW